MARPSFYGWNIVGVALFSLFIGTGAGFYIFNAFLNPLCDAYGWSRTQINIAPALGSVVGLAATLVYGFLLKKIKIKTIMSAGAILAAISFMALGRVSSIWLFYCLFITMVIGVTGFTGITANAVVSNWFSQKRGKAMGIANIGISLSGVILPYLALKILSLTDLPTAFFVIGCLILAVAPMALFIVKDNPEDMGLLPDGLSQTQKKTSDNRVSPDASVTASSTHTSPAAQLVFTHLIRSGNFWKIGVAYGLAIICLAPTMFQLAPRFVDAGLPAEKAMLLLTATAAFGALGKYAWGILCDRFDTRLITAICMFCTAVGVLIGLYASSILMLGIFMVVFGFSMGGIMSTHPIITADVFGRDGFVTVYKYLALFFIFEVPGFILMGYSFDTTGSYQPVYIFHIVILLISSGLLLSIRKPEQSELPLRV